jgi:NAD(P)-dependent dehydrogenase (short-subunit alcohol dehydrogenase family)
VPSERSVLVVGATGALRPAALALAARGEHVFALARPGHRLTDLANSAAQIEPVAVDFTDLASLPRTLPDRYDGALLYCPTAPAEAIRLFADRAARVVHMLTSSAADPAVAGCEPDLTALPAAGIRVLLGWRPDRTWHTPDEISSAALTAWDDGRDRLLGTVRPWTDRP